MSEPIFEIIDGAQVELTGDRLADYIARLTPTLDQLKAAKTEALRVVAEGKFATGAPVEHESQTLHVSISDGSRADIGSMATNATATIVTSGVVPWLDAYVLGWITIENIRKPLPTPAEGLAFASSVASFYADTRQNWRTLKDAIAAAADEAALDAIDIESGWPG